VNDGAPRPAEAQPAAATTRPAFGTGRIGQIEGSRGVAEAVGLCRPEVVCAYPVPPQTHIVEALATLVKAGDLTACEFVNVESEFAAMSVAIGASAAGARAYTATASQGLLYMTEALYNAAGLGLPIDEVSGCAQTPSSGLHLAIVAIAGKNVPNGTRCRIRRPV
jgi:hypothetical protein